ncbi:hypothetical protein DVK44_12075 [Streptomyces paludis]|uniref:Post-SET domain-containing protein n=2 Tax=Streptomyces paludis TaxID=2282738 RepID=A0A345I0R4_9ACTN|nr:hypothetical protein DVK44_12075 [Streptomyces paludis]
MAAGGLDERVLGRRWTVRLDGVGRGSVAVRVSCSRPSCAARLLPSAAAGREAAVEHLKAHLRAAAAPRAEAYCACKAEGCRGHVRPADRGERAEHWRCGGAVVLAVLGDREGRWWQALECCSRCAAATPGTKIVSTAAQVSAASGAVSRTAPAPARVRAAEGRPAGLPASAQFSHSATAPVPQPVSASASASGSTSGSAAGSGFGSGAAPASGSAPAPGPAPGPAASGDASVPGPGRRRPRRPKIAQRIIPYDLRPVVLRDELIELGDLFRAYQRRSEPDLALLADLHARKARAFIAWADATCDTGLRLDAQRAEQAATAARLQHQHRTGVSSEDPSGVTRLLTGAAQWEHARSVLAHVTDSTPLPGPEARLLVVMLTLRAAHSGTGNLVGQDLNSLGLSDPEQLMAELIDCGWLSIPGTVDDLVVSRPENPTPVTVPSLTPQPDAPGPFVFGKKMRPKLSGWAQRVISDKKLRKSKAPADVRLLALTLATRISANGRLGSSGEGVALDFLASACAVDRDELPCLIERLTAADWLAEAVVTETHLTGRLTERVLPLTCPLPTVAAPADDD